MNGWVIAALALAITALLVLRLFARLGTWLTVADPLQPAQSIVVLGGRFPFCAMEAAAIYQQGYAPEVWLTQCPPLPERLAAARLGIDVPPDHTNNRLVLEKLGVPPDAVVLLEPGENTADEIRNAALEMRRRRTERVILISAKRHARRVKIFWKMFGGTGQAFVRYSSEDPFLPERWWRSTRDIEAVLHELGGLVNACIGFPLKTEPVRLPASARDDGSSDLSARSIRSTGLSPAIPSLTVGVRPEIPMAEPGTPTVKEGT
jgi:uncharacterized SAM-binding protein YcdF (DUF218 family)